MPLSSSTGLPCSAFLSSGSAFSWQLSPSSSLTGLPRCASLRSVVFLPSLPVPGLIGWLLQWVAAQCCWCLGPHRSWGLCSMTGVAPQGVVQLPWVVVVVACPCWWTRNAVGGLCLDLSGLMGLSRLSHAKGKKVWCKLTHQEFQEHDQSRLQQKTCCPCFLELHLVLCMFLAVWALVLLD